MTRNNDRLTALEATLTSSNPHTDIDARWTTLLTDLVTGKRDYDCACCEPFLSIALANTKALLTTDPSEWRFVPQQPKPPMPEHLRRQLTEGTL